jgi:hypothetical protein
MHVVLLILALLVSLGAFICAMIIVVDAFRYEAWMGILAFLVPPYFIYYSIFEFDHEYKWQLTIGSLLGSSVAAGLYLLSQGRSLF